MILQALADLARREQLLLDPAFEPVEVDYLIHLGPGGKFLRTTAPRGEPRTNRKGKQVRAGRPHRRPVPRRSDRTSGSQAEFLVDKAEYVFGIQPSLRTGSGARKKAAAAN